MPALAAAFVLGLLNAIIKPVLILFTLPLTLVSFGLFLLVLNGLLLGLVAAIVPGFYVAGLTGAVIGSVLISIVSWILSLTTGPR
jgi:putative membrane protein